MVPSSPAARLAVAWAHVRRFHVCHGNEADPGDARRPRHGPRQDRGAGGARGGERGAGEPRQPGFPGLAARRAAEGGAQGEQRGGPARHRGAGRRERTARAGDPRRRPDPGGGGDADVLCHRAGRRRPDRCRHERAPAALTGPRERHHEAEHDRARLRAGELPQVTMGQESPMTASYDIVLRGGRIIDPETGLDGVADVAVSAGRIAFIGNVAVSAAVDLDVAGHVVTAGFVDLHSHTTGIAGNRLRALDGVTTALELEAGFTPVSMAYKYCAAHGLPVNYGFAASWAHARMEAVGGIGLQSRLENFWANIAAPSFQRPASPAELTAITSRLAAELADGGLGIGVLTGYAPNTDPGEYLRVAALAAEAGVPTFTHARDLADF